MGIQATALVLATILAAYPKASAERSSVEITDREQCYGQELSWTFTNAEATPPSIQLEGGNINRRYTSVRM